MHTRENAKAAKEDKMKQEHTEKISKENTATERKDRQIAFALKQAHTSEEGVQETPATECQDRQNHFRITKTLCTSHYNKR